MLRNEVGLGEPVKIAGWGRTTLQGNLRSAFSKILNYIDLTILDNSICANGYGIEVLDSMICAKPNKYNANGAEVRTCVLKNL